MDEMQRFLDAANKLGASEGMFAKLDAEPWPEYFTNVALRMARVVAPDLKKEDLKERPEHFHGICAALFVPLIHEAREVNLTEFPDDPLLNTIKHSLEYLQTEEFAQYRELLAAASNLPAEQTAAFFGAFGDGLKRDISVKGVERFGDNNTAFICLFLLIMRPLIEGKKVKTVTELFKLFMQLREAVPSEKEFFAKNPSVRKSLEAQFRKICSEDKVKLRGKGRPRKK